MSLHRRSIRLREFDYAGAGAYFVTICTIQRTCLFGEIVEGEMRLSSLGLLVEEIWRETPLLRPNITLDAFVVMPNHLHGIIVIGDETTQEGIGSRLRSPAQTLGATLRGFKAAATKRARRPLWQCNYYEHIIRDDRSLERIR